MRAYKNYLIPKYHTNKIREKTTIFKIKYGKSKAIRKYNVPATRLNYGAIHSSEFKRMWGGPSAAYILKG